MYLKYTSEFFLPQESDFFLPQENSIDIGSNLWKISDLSCNIE